MLISNGWTSVEVATPQVVVEAIMVVVRERGLAAFKEPATRRRLADCDQAAREQINLRIDKLVAAGRIPEAAHA